jgi:hypothetical protein
MVKSTIQNGDVGEDFQMGLSGKAPDEMQSTCFEGIRD